jgi:hypothetical protein
LTSEENKALLVTTEGHNAPNQERPKKGKAMTTQTQHNTATTTIPEAFQAFAAKLQDAMNDALEVQQNKREYGQLAKILACVSDTPQSITPFGFWTSRAKVLAAEWEDIRTDYLEDQAEQAQQEAEAPAKPKRNYRKIDYIEGQNPFRAGSKNAKAWDLLVEGGHTAEEIAEASAADLKSVNYLIWLARRSGIEIQADKEIKTYRLAPEAQTD